MTAMKRKGPSEHYGNSHIVVSVADVAPMTMMTWDDTKQKLKDLCTSTTAIMDDITMLPSSSLPDSLSFGRETEALLQASRDIQSMLAESIAKERSACQLEMADVYRLQMELQSLQADHDDLEQELQDMEQETSTTKDRIYEAQQICQQEMEEIDLVEAERMMHVPKLKEQISLFATTTGIKWDYEQEEALAGQIAMPSLESYCRFSIDPKMHTKFEVANYLWAAMEGDKNPALNYHV
jgi:hypothetical protein